MKINKKAINVIITTTLLLLVAVVTGSVIMNWQNHFISNFLIKSEYFQNSCDIEIAKMETVNSISNVVVRDLCSSYQIIDFIKIDGIEYSPTFSVIDGITYIQLNDTLDHGVKNIVIKTNKGIYDKDINYKN